MNNSQPGTGGLARLWRVGVLAVVSGTILLAGMIGGQVAYLVATLPEAPPPLPVDGPALLGMTQDDAATSPTQAVAAEAGLPFQPLIPETADLPEVIKPLRVQLNREFDAIRQGVVDYEREKKGLPPEERRRRLAELEKLLNETGMRLITVLDPQLAAQYAGQGQITRQLNAMNEWFSQNVVENLELENRHIAAAFMIEHRIGTLRYQWETEQWAADPMQRPDRRQFEVARGEALWQREAINLRQAGGWQGYGRLTMRVVERGVDRLRDRVGLIEQELRGR